MKKSRSLRSRLFWNSLAILLLGMGLAGVLVWRAVESAYLQTQRDNLLAQASLTAAALQGQPLPAAGAAVYQQSSNVQPGIHTRLLSEQGALVFSLPMPAGDVSAPPAENGHPISPEALLARPEIASALRGQTATAVRRVDGRPVLYAAAPVLGADGQVSGLVYLATPLPAAGLPLPLLLELGGAGLVAVLLALGAGSLLARQIAAPLEEVARAAGAVSAGNLEQSVPAGSAIRELDELGRVFNGMTESLRQADQAKNAFVADVTHELRTPLTVIKGTIETLEDGALDDLAGRGPLLEAMQRETERLIRLVNDLLVLTRAYAGTLQMDIQPLELADLALARCNHLGGLAARHGVRLEVCGSSEAWVMGDADRLAQVLDNLLDNAIRYSPAGETVTVEIQEEGEGWVCGVRDRGAGISAEHLPLIFERFYRADASRNRETSGAGLGLAIARALIQAQGGQISAESQAGQGTLVRVILPKKT